MYELRTISMSHMIRLIARRVRPAMPAPLPRVPPAVAEAAVAADDDDDCSGVILLTETVLAMELGSQGIVRVGVGFSEDLKLLHFYMEFLAAPNFYTFTLLTHFLLRVLRTRVCWVIFCFARCACVSAVIVVASRRSF